MDKKIVWLPYDFDTALGINNEGALVFGYELEDTDHLTGGADVYNGQESVVWNNLRDAFSSELAAMYRTLRSDGVISYQAVEAAFEAHQGKWSEAIFNEDAWFKYIQPLIDDGTGSYLEMLQGSKAEQRKWWLYNRFRYIDSKYNAGDALSDLIQLRGYAKANITVTPYADIYPSVKYGSYLVQERGRRGTATTLVNPLDQVNDTEIYIYSASQLASVGDLSGLKVGFADFSMATKLQSLKIGDSSNVYENPNLTTLTLGNNVLLQSLDVRNCSGLTGSVDVSGCVNIENVYFSGTNITGVGLPNGGRLKVLHLPGTITNLTIRNQPSLTDLTIPTYANITTLRLENIGAVVDARDILADMAAGSRVRLVGFAWECDDYNEIEDLYDLFDTMRGLDEAGANVDKAQLIGIIHTDTLTGAQIAALQARYPYITVTADSTTSVLSYYNGSTLITTETITNGGDGHYSGETPTKTADYQYTYTFAGWSKADDNTVDSDALLDVWADRNVYACFTGTLRTYRVTFYRAQEDGGGTLYYQDNVPYGTTPTYGGSTPTTTRGSAEDYPFEGWSPELAPVDGRNLAYYAVFGSIVEIVEITDSWSTIINSIPNGTYKTKYKLGNYKNLTIPNQLSVEMMITAFDGKGKIDFVAMRCLIAARVMNSESKTGGWANSDLRTYLNGDLLNAILSAWPVLDSHIKTVTNVQSVHDGAGIVKNGQTTQDQIWIPSEYEVNLDSIYEDTGVSYSKIFKTNNDRIKYLNASPGYWWLRSQTSSGTFFRVVSNTGTGTGADGTRNMGVVIGFSLE